MPMIKISDINIYYEITGKGDPILFLHGLGSSTRDWEKQVSEFSKVNQVITTDFRGHGRSAKPSGPYSIELFANDIATFLRSILTTPAHIVGLSMGGAVSFHLAIDHPDVVKSITISNMSAAMPVKTLAQKKRYYARVFMVKFLGTKKMGRIIASNVFPKEDQQNLRYLLEKRWAENPRKPYLSALHALKNWNIMDRLNSIKCPVFVIHSENDYSPLAHKKEYTAMIPNATLVQIPDSGHIVNMEKPNQYNKVLKGFLDSQN